MDDKEARDFDGMVSCAHDNLKDEDFSWLMKMIGVHVKNCSPHYEGLPDMCLR